MEKKQQPKSVGSCFNPCSEKQGVKTNYGRMLQQWGPCASDLHFFSGSAQSSEVEDVVLLRSSHTWMCELHDCTVGFCCKSTSSAKHVGCVRFRPEKHLTWFNSGIH